MSNAQYIELFEQFTEREFEAIICIDTNTGMASTLHAMSEHWKKTMGVEYAFEKTIREYLIGFSVDSKTENLITSLDNEHIKKHLRECGSYTTYFTTIGEDSPFCIKRAAFFQNSPEKIWLVIIDITKDYNGVISTLNQMDYAVLQTKQDLARKNTFLNLMSRNIRTPLYSIMGLTQITSEMPQGNTAIEAYLHKISMSGTYMSETIDNILELRRIASRPIILSPKSFRMQEFLHRIRNKIEPVFQDREMIFSKQSDISENLTVYADPYVLEQIIMHLLQSSLNYMLSGGTIQMNVHELIQREHTVTIEFSVNCLGIVIDSERLKAIFQPYNYLLERLDEDPGSLDISLIILKRYAMAMGADTLMAETDERKGTNFSITLTMNLSRETRETDQESIQDIISRLSGLRVLVADDNEINLEVSEKILTGRGLHVTTAKNGREALDIFEKSGGAFDIIIMDILMPVMDGLEATKRIRALQEIPNAKSVPIVAMTANAFQKHFEESFKAGMNKHLVKPINHENLFRVIAELVPAQAAI